MKISDRVTAQNPIRFFDTWPRMHAIKSSKVPGFFITSNRRENFRKGLSIHTNSYNGYCCLVFWGKTKLLLKKS
ncbi:hypothetical protein L1887_02978 [Cichorium endivia]|nr:hypothetical protein L1887_02978 [Cichorium endivia]